MLNALLARSALLSSTVDFASRTRNITGMARVDKLLLGTALLVPWLFIWQGVDVTDQGYLLTIYRCFLRHPEAVAHTSHMWLTNVIGGVWDLLFGRLGVVGQRALWALCTSLGMFVSFQAIRTWSGERAAGIGVLVASSFLAGRRETCFSYNTLTGLLSAAAAVTLFHAICRRSLRGLMLAGFFLGLSPFARLSNVLHASMLAALLFAAVLDRSRLAGLPRELTAAVLGYLGAIAVALVTMRALGHWTFYWTAVHDLLNPSAPSVNHSTSATLHQVLDDHLVTMPMGLLVFALGTAVVKLVPHLPRPLVLCLYLLLGGLGVYVLTLTSHKATVEPWTSFVIGPCYVVLASIALGLLGRSFEERMACFIGLIALFVTPIGSGNGIRAAYLGVWFALPVALAVLYAAGTEARVPLRALAIVAACTLLGESLHRDLTYTYRDRPRFELSTPVNHPQLYAQFTTAARAKTMREVLAALGERVRPGDFLLAYDGTPLLQYLTFTRPYTGHPWLMTDDDPAVVPGLLSTALSTTKCLPVAVRSRKSARNDKWPRKGPGLERQHKATRKAIVSFLQSNGYERTWRNDFFEILEPGGESGRYRQCR